MKNRTQFRRPTPKITFVKRLHRSLTNHSALISSVASLITIIAGIGAFYLYSLQSYTHLSQTRDQDFIGIWTNPTEGCIGCSFNNDPDRPIILNLDVKDGQIGGILDASGWLNKGGEASESKDNKHITFKTEKEKVISQAVEMAIGMANKYLNVEGTLTFRGGQIVIWDYVGGEKTIMGRGTLEMENEGYIRLKMEGDHFLGIPDTAELYKSYDDDGKPCKEVDPEEGWRCKSK
jgi:hypothetical protein